MKARAGARNGTIAGLLIALVVGAFAGWGENRELGGLSTDLLLAITRTVAPNVTSAPSDEVAIVAIDEETYRRPPFAGVPEVFWTDRLGTLIENLVAADVEVIGLDLVYPTSADSYVKGYDKPFLRALRSAAAADKIVIAQVRHQGLSIQPHAAQIAMVGPDRVRSTLVTADEDGVVRRVPLAFDGAEPDQPGRVPSLVGAIAARVAARAPASDSVALNFLDDRAAVYSLADLVACAEAGNGTFFREHFARRVVLIGAILDLEDRKLTAERFAPRSNAATARCALPAMAEVADDGSRRTTPGVVVLAQALLNLSHQTWLRPLAPAADAAVLFLLAVSSVCSGLLVRPRRAALLLGGGAILWSALSVIAFAMTLVLPWLSGLLSIGLAGGLSLGYRVAIMDRARHRLTEAFSRYLPRREIERLESEQVLPELGGEMRTVTVLFCDLAGFTAMAEHRSPGQVVNILNRYFETMTGIVMQHQGIALHFLGDGILAAFGAPFDNPHHARDATLAALAMQDAAATLKVPTEDGDLQLAIRVGLHTGNVLIGNIGHSQRFNYTLIGDAVNLASRLESIAKYYALPITVSEDVARAAPDVAFIEIDTVRVVGRAAPVSLYCPVRSDAPQGKDWVDYPDALRAWRAGSFDAAAALFERMAQHGNRVAARMAERARGYGVSAPAGWNGITDMTAK